MKNNQGFYIVREDVDASDLSYPEVGSGQNLESVDEAVVEVILEGSSPSVDITMLCAAFDGDEYVPVGTPITLTQSEKFTLFVDNNQDVNAFLENLSGTNAKVTVRIKPKN